MRQIGAKNQAPKSHADRSPEFEQLQTKLIPLWQDIVCGPGGPIQSDNTVVVLPSISIHIDLPASALHAYEQRMLFLLLLLRQPYLRLIYVTSIPVQQSIIDYYLGMLPGGVYSSARKRLHLVGVDDSSAEPLSKKLLDRPHLISRIRALIPDVNRAHIVPFNTTDLERRLALALGLPMYAADPAFYAFGTKSGGRHVFAEAGVQYPIGFEDVYSEVDFIEAICRMSAEKPALKSVIAKLNDGVSGMGNATIDLERIPPSGNLGEREAVFRALRAMCFELPGIEYAGYLAAVEKGGAIVEELITGHEVRSPSAQLRVTPLGEVELLSTHDQILGGPTCQSFLGARFPADTAYAWPIMREAEKIGRWLALEGVIGRFSVDFVVVQSEVGQWTPYAVEINLRKGGTTGPYLTLQYLTDGRYDAFSGIFTTMHGDPKCYVASDHVESPAYRVFTPDLLFDIVSRHGLHYDHASQTGIVLHMLSNVAASGQFGATVIGNSHGQADELYSQFIRIIDCEAEAL